MRRLIALALIVLANLMVVSPSVAAPYGAGCYGTDSGVTVGSRTLYSNPRPIGDIYQDSNNVVNLYDFVKFLQAFGGSSATGFNCESDLLPDVNNVINVFDFSVFLQHFGESS